MILHVYSMKNRLSGIFEKPFVEVYEPKEYTEALCQSLALAPVDSLMTHKEFDCYHLGTFDSKTGEMVSLVEFLVSLEPICLAYVASKESKVEGAKNEQVESA